MQYLGQHQEPVDLRVQGKVLLLLHKLPPSAGKTAQDSGVKNLEVLIKGPGPEENLL